MPTNSGSFQGIEEALRSESAIFPRQTVLFGQAGWFLANEEEVIHAASLRRSNEISVCNIGEPQRGHAFIFEPS